ncbi:MAG: transglutaminase family protein [Gemmataceae bacterium]
MILEIQHETRLAYSEPVTESVAEMRMEPASDAEQSCRSFHLAVSPPTGVFRYVDGFGNRVHHFNVSPAHREVHVLAASVVETCPRPRDLSASAATLPLDPATLPLELLDFLTLRGPARHTPRLGPLLDALLPRPGQPLAEVVTGVRHHIHERFEYARDVTLASSPIDDVLTHGKGVCQDFTHLMIAILRTFGVPARYVSGYIHREGQESQSHAWCEAWMPDLGWVGLDPTNDSLVDERFVKVATGRDFTDVPPNKGLFKGKATEAIRVRVETRTLPALPSLSWQEQLPPLQAPLTEIVSGRRALSLTTEDDASQQQQQ